MKVLLPHRTVSLDSSLEPNDRVKVIETLLKEEIEFHSETMTLEEYLTFTWKKQNSKVIMDMFSYYLTKEEKNLEVLSHSKEKEISKGTKKYTNFSNLSEDDKELLGLPTSRND